MLLKHSRWKFSNIMYLFGMKVENIPSGCRALTTSNNGITCNQVWKKDFCLTPKSGQTTSLAMAWWFDDRTNDMASPPRILPRSRILPNTPSITQAKFYRIVVCSFKTAATFKAKAPPLPLCFSILLFSPLKQANQRHRMQSRWLTACAWRWGSAAPWFKRAASLPKEREGKATGADRHLVCVVFCCVFVCCKASILLAIGDLLHICELVQ